MLSDVLRDKSHTNSATRRKGGKSSKEQRLVGCERLRLHRWKAYVKRDRHIIDEIIADSNMEEAFSAVLSGVARKKSKFGKNLLNNKAYYVDKIKQEIRSGEFHIEHFSERIIVEAGKERRIQIIPMEKRIGAFAIMNIVDKHLRPRYIRTTGASIKRRGMHDLANYIQSDMQRDEEGTMYAYKCDVHHFYDSINPDDIMNAFRTILDDPTLERIINGFVRLLDNGISKGLRSSQGLSNMLMSVMLDHYLKDELRVKHYYRYCDDLLVLCSSKHEAWMIRDVIVDRLNNYGLDIKPDERVFPSSQGIDMLGYVIYNDHMMLRKRIKQNAARKLSSIKSKRRRKEVIASLYGCCKHANCNNLFRKLTGLEMKKFSELGVAYKPADGKKRFPGEAISVRELVKETIIVKDFERGVKTEQGEDRYIVSIELAGKPRKFFTNSEEMKNILNQVEEANGFPFETVIQQEFFGKGRTKYIFT